MQALVSETTLGTPRRAVVGWDPSRLAMILAVLETRCGMRFGSHDVYLNVAGGLRLAEPAADLAVAAALVSSRAGVATPRESVYFGEVSLSGAVRPVAQTGAAAEARRNGLVFTGAFCRPAAAKVCARLSRSMKLPRSPTSSRPSPPSPPREGAAADLSRSSRRAPGGA